MGQHVLEKGDTKPPLKVQAQDFEGDPIDVKGAMLYFNMFDRNGDIVVDQGSVNIVNDGTDGKIEHRWETGETDEVGVYKAEFVAEYSDGVLTIPNDGFIDVRINTINEDETR